MRRIVGAFVLACASVLPGGHSSADELATLPTVDAVVLASARGEDVRATEIRGLHVEHGITTTRRIGAVAHAPGAEVRGDFSRGVAWVVADEEGARDADWGAALYRVDARGAIRVTSGVGHARRPLASNDAVYVERGSSGPPPTLAEIKSGGLRVDHVEIDAIDAATLATRTVVRADAYALHLAGEHAGELVVYRVDAYGTAILGVDERTGASRTIASVAPFARDFSIDGGSLVLSNRDASGWTIERVDLASGARSRVRSSTSEQPAALAFAGRMAWSAEGRHGLVVDGRTVAPMGDGFDAPELGTRDGAWLATLHVPTMDEAIVHVATGRALRLGTERITVIALDGVGGGRR